MRLPQHEQPLHSPQERGAVGGRHQPNGCRTQPLHLQERAGEESRVAAQLHGDVVAALLALQPDPTRDPPDRRVIEEQGLNRCLNKIDQIVTSADMSKLVSQQSFQLLRAQS